MYWENLKLRFYRFLIYFKTLKHILFLKPEKVAEELEDIYPSFKTKIMLLKIPGIKQSFLYPECLEIVGTEYYISIQNNGRFYFSIYVDEPICSMVKLISADTWSKLPINVRKGLSFHLDILDN